MISKRLVKHIVNHADVDTLRTFVNIVLESVQNRETWRSDNIIINAIELISNVANPYEEKHIDKDKLLEHIKKYAYKAEYCDTFRIKYIDNFNLEVIVEYKQNDSDCINATAIVSISDVACDDLE